MSRRAPLILIVLLSIVISLNQSFAREIKEFTLKNGLKVILLEEHKAPVVTFQVWYRVGSRDEVIGKTGLSHLTEHMMFKGTKKHGKGEFSRIVSMNGGNENAFTSKDYTAYFENFAADRIELSLELESDRMTNLIVDPKEFLLERDVVKEERRQSTDDDPYSLVVENMYAIAFLAYPYRSPIIGWMSDLDSLVRDDVYDHYKRYYAPNNATIVIVGDFETDKLLKMIKKHFEKIPKAKAPPDVKIDEPEQFGERRIYVKKEAQLPYLFAGYRAPNYKDNDIYALTLLSNILSSGKSSRFYRSLVYEKSLALNAGGGYDGFSIGPELFYFYGMPRQGKTLDELEKAIYEEIERVKKEPVTDMELQKAKNQEEAAYILGQDSIFYQARQIGSMETIGAGYKFIEEYVDKVRKVSKEDILRVANKYLVEDRRTVGILVPVKSDEKEGGQR
ncbi:MAG TPA: pitrilysin family protein [Nitrospiria bacterium]|nr:pitrilysin family protein [Nitrospiria bacterium]